ncbi:MAG: GNAT family N-acetyltransferase [Gaiellaceae bacterium]
MNDLEIRPVTSSDRDVVFSLLKDAALWLRANGIDYWQSWLDPSDAHVRWINKGLESGEFFLVESNGSCIGCFRLQFSDEMFWGTRTEPAGYVHSMTIARSLAGQGIGRLLLATIEARLRADGKRYLRLDCGSSVVGLRRYYESCGFRAVGETSVAGEALTLYEKPIAATT